MARHGPLSAVQVIALRFDPALVQFSLDTATADFGLKGAWTIDALPPRAAAGLNTGQFIGGIPWGWLVLNGREVQPPGTGSLAMAFVVNSAGQASLVAPNELDAARSHARFAFQSYPALLSGDGQVPWELEAAGRGVNLTHRDSRLALGLLSDGTVVAVLTRYRALGRAGETLPWGPTVPEMAVLMRSLGCDRAVLLDGGISSQMVVRRPDGELKRWPNWRRVPLALVVAPGEPDSRK